MMTESEIQTLIAEQLDSDASNDAAAELAADVARLAAAGLIEICRSIGGETTIAPREGMP